MMQCTKRTYNLYLLTVFIILTSYVENASQAIHGRYTRDITQYELCVPQRVSIFGDLISFDIPQYFEHDANAKYKRDALNENYLNYNINFNGLDHHVALWPNHDFVSANVVHEVYEPAVPVAERRIRRMDNKLCHYVGRVKGHENSRVALSLCDGMAGYLVTDNGQYFIEPLAEHQPNANGEHVHVIYRRETSSAPRCGTREPWTEAWRERFRRKYAERRGDAGTDKAPSGTTNLQSIHRYLETLVVADKKFIDYHKDVDTETYIMTIMNMVSNFYHDSSAGNQMDVVVVRIMYLEKMDEHMDLSISENAEETLASFCKWQMGINPADINNPQHHDIAVLLTRYDLCSDNVTDCNLMGLAYVAAACTQDKPCAINEDSGLTLGITVTHEMGHVMGCGHDNNEDSPCDPQTPEGNYHVMSPYVHMKTTEWSSCSRKFITELFENNLGECLNDEPQESLFKENNMPPGSVYDANFQCNLEFPGTKQCVTDQEKICKKLFCETSSTSCSTKGEPPADGTKCGENKWCFNEECVEIGARPEAVDGGWGEWGGWSDCSRTCGGGVSFAERECNNPLPQHRGKYCTGERKKVQLCNTNPCEPSTETFRSIQCTELNSKPFKERLHTWKPFRRKDLEPCVLYCINEEGVFVKMAPRVKDGTSCKEGTKNRCIFGVCRRIGCDWVLDSDAAEDKCGVCNGDGRTCKIVDEKFTKSGNGYLKIVQIPKGCRNIIVTEEKPSSNTIAVSADDEKTFYLNGNYTEQRNGDYDFGGVRGLYDHPDVDMETLVIAGPLSVPIVLHVVCYDSGPNHIRYTYSEPLPEDLIPKEKLSYNWDFLDFDECSSRCGGGIKTSKPACVEKKNGKVNDKFCAEEPKPEAKTMACNEQECKTKWKKGAWGKCSACKFRSGLKTRKVECVREAKVDGRDDTVVEESKCLEKKPATRRLCCSNKPCPKTRRNLDEFEEKLSRVWAQINKDAAWNPFDYESDVDLDTHAKSEIYAVPDVEYINENDAENSWEFKNEIYNMIRRDSANQVNSSSTSAPATKSSTKNKSQVVQDRVPANELKVIEVPKKEGREQVKLSDEAYDTLGDKVGDTLDYCHEKLYTGKQAEEVLKQIKKNQTKTAEL